MKRYKLLLILVTIGLLAVYQFLPIGDYRIGLINGLRFLGFIILYLIVLAYELYINFEETKYEKKSFDKSSIIITSGLILLFFISQNLNIFESKTILSARTQEKFDFELKLRKNEKFTLVEKWMDYDQYYIGKYKIKNDTLRLFGNITNIDTLYFIDKKTNRLISINDFKPRFQIKKTSP